MIQHESFVDIHLKDPTLFKRLFDCQTFSTFLKNIERESTGFEKFKETFETKYNLIGDLFEIFAESFFKIQQGDNRVGICKYSPTDKAGDNGVDGVGVGIDGNPATVQVKYRGNPSEELLERDIKNFGYQSLVRYNVDKDTKTNMVIFTSAKGLHWHTDTNVFLGRMRTINNEMISSIVDNNMCFWISLNELIQESIKFYFDEQH